MLYVESVFEKGLQKQVVSIDKDRIESRLIANKKDILIKKTVCKTALAGIAKCVCSRADKHAGENSKHLVNLHMYLQHGHEYTCSTAQ